MSMQRNVCIAPTHDQAVAELDAGLARRGMDLSSMSAEDADGIRNLFAYGDPDEVAEKFNGWKALGVDGFTMNCLANGHVPERAGLLGETLAPVVAG